MFRVKEMSNSSFIKLITSVIAVFLFSASTADQKPSIGLAQLSEGFNAEQKYMALIKLQNKQQLKLLHLLQDRLQ